MGFTRTEQVQIGPVEDGDSHLGLQTLEPIPEVVVAFLVRLL
jgi:hypothetical protein